MEITCQRCQTEYDFDDALVSERGTTVRCTNCGEQFKVFRPSHVPLQERWLVQRRDGRELLFTNVGDLQRAITNMQVGRHDVLVRGSDAPRPLGAIPELEPFFLSRLGQSTPAPSAAPSATQPYEPIGPRSGRTERPPAQGPAAPAADGRTAPAFGTPSPPATGAPGQVAARASATMPGFASAPGAATPAPAAAAETPSPFDVHAQRLLDPLARHEPPRGGDTLRAGDHTGQAGVFSGPRVFAAPNDAAGRSSDPSVDPDDSAAPREATPYRSLEPSYDSRDAARISYGSSRLVCRVDGFHARAASFAGAARPRAASGAGDARGGRRHGRSPSTCRKLSAIVKPPARIDAASGPRVDALLDEGERALSEGDIETAKEAFDKASALAERDARWCWRWRAPTRCAPTASG